MEMEITDTITDVDEKEWENFAGREIESSYNWCKVMEDSGMVKMHYIFLRENKKVVAAACCYLFKETLYIEMPFIEVAAPLGFSSAFYSKTPEQTRMLIKGLEEVQKKEKAKGILICGLKKEEQDLFKKEVKGFTDFPLRENTYIDLNFTDFEDYLSSLDTETRRSVRKTLNRAEKRWGIKCLVTNEFSQWKGTACRLQKCTCEKHQDDQWLLREEFYDALEKHLKERTELTLFFKDDVPIVCGLSFNSPEISQHKFAGIDQKYREYQAYFLLYYEGIRRALERRQKRIYFGATTYAFKKKIGCKREKIPGLVKLKNPLLNLVFKLFKLYTAFFNLLKRS